MLSFGEVEEKHKLKYAQAQHINGKMKKCFSFFFNEKKCFFNMSAGCKNPYHPASMNNIGHKVHVKIYMDHQIMDHSEIQSYVAQDNIRLGRTT